jgi:hypothetical protein
MPQDGRIDEARKLGLAPHYLFGLVTDTRPDRIDVVERTRSFRLDLSHAVSANALQRGPRL